MAIGPQKIMLIRHAEKPTDKARGGCKEDGTPNKRSISVRGWQRAGALVTFFAHPVRPKIATPNIVFAAARTDDPTVKPDDAKSLRPLQTVTPLAAKLGLTVRNDIPVGGEPALVAALKDLDGTVLVAWEHKRIPTIANGFANAPADWGDVVFDMVWVLDRNPDGTYAFSIVNQDLLLGDKPA